MARKKHNTHDAYVRETFIDNDRAINFFENYLPKDIMTVINISTLIPTQKSYINTELNEHFSDLVFEVTLAKNNLKAEIAMLFEHKSEPDKNVMFQIGHYTFSEWIAQINHSKNQVPIIPIIYYQGKNKWNVPAIKDRFKQYPKEIIDLMPDLPFIYIPLRDIDDESIINLRHSLLSMALLAQKTKINPLKLEKDINKIFKLFPSDTTEWNFLELTLVYVLEHSDFTRKSFIQAIDNIPTKIKKNIMSTYDQIIQHGEQIGIQKGEQIGIQKGEQIGIQKGEQIGIQKEKIKVVLSSNELGIPVQNIAKIANLNEKEVLDIINKSQLN